MKVLLLCIINSDNRAILILNNIIKVDLIHLKIQIKLTNDLAVINQAIFGPNSNNLNKILIIRINRIITKIGR